MSNHSGSYMLNEVLRLLDRHGVFDMLGREQTQIFAQAVIKIGHHYDCNPGEILEDIGEKVGLCSYCDAAVDQLIDGLCLKCHKEIG
ncbi:hypothetical protein [Thiocapsa rosea]|uniref:Uncharacterized protein n=1 Tax=Thiocapsa rosea TaxID=69360 RepID=A0A495VAW2_9GAMM|nr:hypothetical protein [Thiocapsa rosea]RKT45890.1 hypothetical protein BDD21_3377 [Thiocapsa rosea]